MFVPHIFVRYKLSLLFHHFFLKPKLKYTVGKENAIFLDGDELLVGDFWGVF